MTYIKVFNCSEVGQWVRLWCVYHPQWISAVPGGSGNNEHLHTGYTDSKEHKAQTDVSPGEGAQRAGKASQAKAWARAPPGYGGGCQGGEANGTQSGAEPHRTAG